MSSAPSSPPTAPRAGGGARWTLIGLGLALLLSIGLSAWFFAQASAQAVEEQQRRTLVMRAHAFATLVSAHQAGGEPEALKQAAAEWSRAGVQVRVVRASGAQLLASSFPQDDPNSVPRRLQRAEKPLFDEANALRAAVETNRAENVLRKPQVALTRPDAQHLQVSIPYQVDGAVAGMVQMREPAQPVAVNADIGAAAVAVIAPLLLAAGALLLLARSGREQSRWLLTLVSLVLLAAANFAFIRYEQRDLERTALATNEQLAAHYTTLQRQLDASAATARLQLPPRTTNTWDTDAFERPLGLISGAGEVERPQVLERLRGRIAQLDQSAWGNVALGALLLAFFSLGFARRTGAALRTHGYAYGYVAPAMVGMLILVMFPFIYGIALSFTGQTLMNQSQPLSELWIGLDNYRSILGDVDVAQRSTEGWVIDYQNFYWTLLITICWTVSNVAVGVTLGMIFALALNTPGLRGRAIYRVLLILPWAIPNYITALVWRGLFHPQFGAINQAIQAFGGEPVAWFDTVGAAFFTGLATNGWLSFPFMMVVILGALQSIPNEMYEAALVEGASRRQRFLRITLPLLKPTLVPAIVLSVVWTFNMFNVIYLVSGGAPAGANEILITKAYKIAFEEYRYAYSAAYSTVVFLILLAYGFFQTRVTRATEAMA